MRCFRGLSLTKYRALLSGRAAGCDPRKTGTRLTMDPRMNSGTEHNAHERDFYIVLQLVMFSSSRFGALATTTATVRLSLPN